MTDAETPTPQIARTPKTIVLELNERCSNAVTHATAPELEPLVGQSYVFLTDLEAWALVLANRLEAPLLHTASHEYAVSLLNSCQGQYRNAFKSLRLVLELCIQSAFLSANLVALSEWLRNDSDTNWASLMDVERGPFSKRLCAAFAPSLVEHAPHFEKWHEPCTASFPSAFMATSLTRFLSRSHSASMRRHSASGTTRPDTCGSCWCSCCRCGISVLSTQKSASVLKLASLISLATSRRCAIDFRAVINSE